MNRISFAMAMARKKELRRYLGHSERFYHVFGQTYRLKHTVFVYDCIDNIWRETKDLNSFVSLKIVKAEYVFDNVPEGIRDWLLFNLDLFC